MAATVPSRRERLRAQTLIEIREHGYAQIAAGGPSALSLNGIAKAMGMSGPAMYRYVASRDELLATLVTESYEDLAGALAEAAHAARRRAAEGRLRAIADAFRAWAQAAPHRYRLVFGSASGSGALDPDRIIPAAHRAMGTILTAVADLDLGAPVPDAVLRRELAAWAERRSEEEAPPASVLLRGMQAWTRLHGLVSLEIEGFFAQVGVDPDRLYAAETDALLV
jgi:AcrR family transcriptional regulator